MSITIREKIKLAPYTSFHIGGEADFFCVVDSKEGLIEALQFAKQKDIPIFVLGGGSNILLSDGGFRGLVLKLEILGVEVIKDEKDKVLIKVGAGESWDGFVKYAVDHSLWGIENLSHIPGFCGAVAVQNVGAYGQEVSQVVDCVAAYDTHSGAIKNIPKDECGFAYRSSIFNNKEKGRYIILETFFVLSKGGKPNVSYGDVAKFFTSSIPTLPALRNAVIEIRDKKFPYPDYTTGINGSAGSFFKNFILNKEQFSRLVSAAKASFGDAALLDMVKKVRMNDDKTEMKIPTACLIEMAGLKGLAIGGAAINSSQPLVILNTDGSATARDVLALANVVREKLLSSFGLTVEFEPEFVGF